MDLGDAGIHGGSGRMRHTRNIGCRGVGSGNRRVYVDARDLGATVICCRGPRRGNGRNRKLAENLRSCVGSGSVKRCGANVD